MSTQEITNSIFIGGPLFTDPATAIANVDATVFTEVVGWAGLEADGAISYSGTNIASGGSYTGPSDWPQQLAQLTNAGKRLQIMIGGWENPSFANVKNLIFPNPGDYPNNPQIGPDTILYKNFCALKAAIPGLNGINLDAEYDAQDPTAPDVPVIVNLSKLLASVDLEATCNPYQNMDQWVDCVAQAPKSITRFYLQTYAGGTGNTPGPWIEALEAKMGPDFDAKGFVFPGMWCKHGDGCADGSTPAEMQSQYQDWHQSSGIQGGWVWIYDDQQTCMSSTGFTLNDYASAIRTGLTG